MELELDPERFVTRPRGSAGVAARRPPRGSSAQREARGATDRRATAQSGWRTPSGGWMQELAVEHAANRCYEAFRAGGVMRDGRRFGSPPAGVCAAVGARGEGQHHRSGLAGGAHPGPAGDPGLQRAGRGDHRADHPRRGGHQRRRRTSGISNRSSTRSCATSSGPGSASGRRRCSPMPGYWHKRADARTSSPTGSRCSSRPTAVCARRRARAGTAAYYAFMRRVLATEHRPRALSQAEAQLEPVFGQIKHNRRLRAASNEEAGPPHGRNGD